jgi:hypothetical protein
VVYDAVTGRVLGTYREYAVGDAAEAQPPQDEARILDLFGADEGALSRVTDGDIANLAALTIEPGALDRPGQMAVSGKRKALVRLPRLRLRSERDVLEGDGKDAVALTIDVLDAQDRVVRDYQGTVHVTTTRGKLSTRGGRTEVKQGQAELTLTSVPETVARVVVRVTAPDGTAAPGELRLRFE